MHEQELVDLFGNLTREEQRKILNMLRELSYMHELKTLDELIRESREKNVARTGFYSYVVRVMMAIYYVQNIEIERRQDRWELYEADTMCSVKYGDRTDGFWLPYLEEVSQSIQLSEQEILTLSCLFHYYFIPRAEKDCDPGWMECFFQEYIKDEKEYEQGTFRISRINDLAKIYMTQKFNRRMGIFSGLLLSRMEEYIKNCLKQHWELSETEEYIKNCLKKHWEECGRAHCLLDIRCFMHNINEKVKERRQTVLSAFERLNQGEPYDRIIKDTGLSFEEIRILDCFTHVPSE